MTQLRFDTSVFPKKIVDYFGYDNETLFSVKLKQNDVSVQWLDDKMALLLIIGYSFQKIQN